MKLTDRIRPGSEAAPWVVSEVAKLEKRVELDEALLRRALEALEQRKSSLRYAAITALNERLEGKV